MLYSHAVMKMKKQFQGSLLLVLATLIWGSTFVAQSTGMDHIGPFTFLAIRNIMGAVFLFLLSFVTDRYIRSSTCCLKQSIYEILSISDCGTGWIYPFTKICKNHCVTSSLHAARRSYTYTFLIISQKSTKNNLSMATTLLTSCKLT